MSKHYTDVAKVAFELIESNVSDWPELQQEVFWHGYNVAIMRLNENQFYGHYATGLAKVLEARVPEKYRLK